uniref:Uncharacterized protein n=1 Tax=Romanomermis culicivorax TaxID=13658 RepID=A0A915KSQ1_ROMCU
MKVQLEAFVYVSLTVHAGHTSIETIGANCRNMNGRGAVKKHPFIWQSRGDALSKAKTPASTGVQSGYSSDFLYHLTHSLEQLTHSTNLFNDSRSEFMKPSTFGPQMMKFRNRQDRQSSKEERKNNVKKEQKKKNQKNSKDKHPVAVNNVDDQFADIHFFDSHFIDFKSSGIFFIESLDAIFVAGKNDEIDFLNKRGPASATILFEHEPPSRINSPRMCDIMLSARDIQVRTSMGRNSLSDALIIQSTVCSLIQPQMTKIFKLLLTPLRIQFFNGVIASKSILQALESKTMAPVKSSTS